jgi:hypothetical protein
MSFLTQNLADRIRGIIKKYATDAFLQRPVVYRKKNDIALPNRYGNAEIQAFTDYNVLSLEVADKDKSNVSKDNDIGAFDDTRSYFLFNVDDLEVVGLFANNKPNMTANVDYIISNGVTFEVTGVEALGQLLDKDVVVKVWVRQLVKKV